MQSSFQDIGLQAIKASDPWDTGGDKASPVFFQFTALREFPCHTVEKEHPGRALWTPQAEETELRIQGAQGNQSLQVRVPERKMLHRRRTPET